MPHPILTYCERHSLSLNRFAGLLGVQSSTVYRLARPTVKHPRKPSAKLMARIEEVTEGEVTMQALYAAHFVPTGPNMCLTGIVGKGKKDDPPVRDFA